MLDLTKPIRLKDDPNARIFYIGKNKAGRIVYQHEKFDTEPHSVSVSSPDVFENAPEKRIAYLTTYKNAYGAVCHDAFTYERGVDHLYKRNPEYTHLVTTVVEVEIP